MCLTVCDVETSPMRRGGRFELGCSVTENGDDLVVVEVVVVVVVVVVIALVLVMVIVRLRWSSG